MQPPGLPCCWGQEGFSPPRHLPAVLGGGSSVEGCPSLQTSENCKTGTFGFVMKTLSACFVIFRWLEAWRALCRAPPHPMNGSSAIMGMIFLPSLPLKVEALLHPVWEASVYLRTEVSIPKDRQTTVPSSNGHSYLSFLCIGTAIQAP